MSQEQEQPMNGVLGGGPAKYNLRMVEQALLHDYPMTPEIRNLVVTQAAIIAGTAKNKRTKLAAMKVLLAADKHNLTRRALDSPAKAGAGGGVQVNIQINEELKAPLPPIEVQTAAPSIPQIAEEVVQSNGRDHPEDV